MTEIPLERLSTVKKDSQGVGSNEISLDRLNPATQESEEEKYSTWQNIYLKARPYLKGTAEGVGLGGGAVVGTAAGIPLGPLAPAGTVAGGALGYAMGKESIDVLDKVFGIKEPETIEEMPGELLQSGKDILAGAEMTTIGEGIPVVAGMAGRLTKRAGSKISIPIREKAIKKKAGERLLNTEGNQLVEAIESNVTIGKAIEKKIPGVKFTRGQLTNDAGVISLERSLLRGGTITERGGFQITGAELNQEQRAFAEIALEKYYQSKLLKEGTVDAFTGKIQTIKDSLDVTVKKAQQAVDGQVARISRVLDDQEAGGVIRTQLRSGKKKLRNQATALYNKIPHSVKVNASPLRRSIKDVTDDFDSTTELPENFPGHIMGGMGALLKKQKKLKKTIYDTVSFQRLRKWRTTILSETRKARAQENDNLVRRLDMLRDGVEESIDSLIDHPGQAGKLYRKASTFYREYAKRYKEGSVADVLQAGKRGEEGKIALANVAKEFFTKDGVDDFLRAVGDDPVAMNAMRDYARYTLKNISFNPYSGRLNPSSAFNWISKNSKVLDKLGVKKELLNVAKTGKDLEVSQAALDVFNKSVASKVLQADVSEIVKEAFKGSNNYGETARGLMKMVKGDKAAEAGLKKAVAEHIYESSKITAEGFFTDFRVSNASLTKQIKKFAPAIRALYKNEPQKRKALMDVHKAYQILERTTKSPIGGGSDTAENLANVVIGAAGARAGRFYLIKSIRDFFNKYSTGRINSYLLRATFDPDYAQSLMSLIKNPANDRVRTHAANLLIYSGKAILEGE